MASSSDWIAEAGKAAQAAPQWLTALGEPAQFRAGAPFQRGTLDPGHTPTRQLSRPVTEPDEDIAANAYARGHAAGLAEARATSQAEAEASAAAQRKLRLALRELDKAAMDTLAADLTETVMALCTQVIAERSIDKDSLARRCRAAAERIGGAAGRCTLRLHPEDIALLDDSDVAGVSLEADTTLERGTLVLEGAEGTVRDGPADWRRAIADALQR